MPLSLDPVNISDKLSQFSELWTQKKIADLNDYEIKLAKLKGNSSGIPTRGPTSCTWSSAAGSRSG